MSIARMASVALAAALVLAAAPDVQAQQKNVPVLAKPFKVTAGGEPIAVDVGHAAPLFYDFDKDGKKDLIVGEFGGGRARIYLNQGAKGKPSFKDFTYLEGGGKHASVPSS